MNGSKLLLPPGNFTDNFVVCFTDNLVLYLEKAYGRRKLAVFQHRPSYNGPCESSLMSDRGMYFQDFVPNITNKTKNAWQKGNINLNE